MIVNFVTYNAAFGFHKKYVVIFEVPTELTKGKLT